MSLLKSTYTTTARVMGAGEKPQPPPFCVGSARDSNSFTVSLNVEAQNKVSFNLTYEELLTRKLGQYEHVVTLNPGQVRATRRSAQGC